MRLPPLVLTIFAALLALGLVARAPDARADRLTAPESARLARGETVIREHTWEPGSSARYIGGLTYTVVDASAAEISGVLEDVESYRRVLPRTKRVKLVSVEPNGDRLVELVQGNAPGRGHVHAPRPLFPGDPRGALLARRLAPARDRRRVRLLPRRAASRAPNGEQRALLTYAVLVDIGPGIVRELFEERVRAALLSVPQLVRRYVAEARHP